MAMKHGYTTVEEYKTGVQRKFSLLETGVIHRPSTRLLLVNVSVFLPFISVMESKRGEESILANYPRALSTASCRLRTR